MTGRILQTASFVVFFSIPLWGQPEAPAAAVVVSDRVTSVGRPVFLKVVTRGLVFTRGGRRVAIRIDDEPAYETLSGADGAAFVKYHPDKAGLRAITAVSEGEEGTGSLLVLEPDDTVIVIGIEGGLQKSLYPEQERRRAREALSELSRTFHLVYLSRWVGTGLAKDWLKKHRFPQSVVLRWRGEGDFKTMENRGVRVKAVIGSAALLRSAPDSIDNRFTFDENHAAAVSGWEEIREALQGGSDRSEQPPDQNENRSNP